MTRKAGILISVVFSVVQTSPSEVLVCHLCLPNSLSPFLHEFGSHKHPKKWETGTTNLSHRACNINTRVVLKSGKLLTVVSVAVLFRGLEPVIRK